MHEIIVLLFCNPHIVDLSYLLKKGINSVHHINTQILNGIQYEYEFAPPLKNISGRPWPPKKVLSPRKPHQMTVFLVSSLTHVWRTFCTCFWGISWAFKQVSIKCLGKCLSDFAGEVTALLLVSVQYKKYSRFIFGNIDGWCLCSNV